jgi:hypothetical protein
VGEDIQQFPLQTEKFILFTLPVELQRTLSQRAAVKAAVQFMNRLEGDVETDHGDPVETSEPEQM